MRKNFSSGAFWEDIIGYSRAVKVGNIIEVAGTTAIENGEVVGLGDAYQQTKIVLQKIKKVIEEADGKLSDVVRTRIYVVDIGQWEKIGKAHGEFFSEIKPASTMVEVSALIHPDILVEIEATAIIDKDEL